MSGQLNSRQLSGVFAPSYIWTKITDMVIWGHTVPPCTSHHCQRGEAPFISRGRVTSIWGMVAIPHRPTLCCSLALASFIINTHTDYRRLRACNKVTIFQLWRYEVEEKQRNRHTILGNSTPSKNTLSPGPSILYPQSVDECVWLTLQKYMWCY